MTVIEWAFWGSVVLLFHAYVGYPAWLCARAALAPRRWQPQAWTPRVAVVMAVYDGAHLIEAKLRSIFASDYPSDRLSVVVVCDGCSDGTAQVIDAFADPRVRVLAFEQRRGKASCLNDAVAATDAEVLLMTDVRQRIDPLALRALTATLADPHVGAVSGELRFETGDSGFARGIDAYWRYEKAIRLWESVSGSAIGVSGALYALRREHYQPLPAGTVLDDVLVPMRVVRRGLRVVLEDAAVAWDRPSEQPLAERARKIRTLAGNFQLLQLAPWLLDPRANPCWFRFASHKLLRLLAPWLMLLLLPLSALLARQHPFYAACLAGLLLVPVLVWCARVLPVLAGWLPVRLLTAFVYLNVFAAQALFAFARNRRLHLW